MAMFLTLRVLHRAGLIRVQRPDKLLGLGLAVARWRFSPAAAYARAAVDTPDQLAVIDPSGQLTFAQVDERSNAAAGQIAAGLGARPGDAVALLARNSAAFVVCVTALSKLGVDVLYLNTGFAGPQAVAVLDRESAIGVVVDPEFTPLFADTRLPVLSMDGALALGGGHPPLAAGRTGRHVILTSGTTGAPKGAARGTPAGAAGLESLVSVLSAIPLRAREVTVLGAPMFHAWGLLHFTLGLVLQSTLVVTPRFDPEATLEMVDRHRASALVLVPVMLQRILELPEQTWVKYDTSSLRIIALSGSALPVSLAERARARFGDVLYNLYGSTEVAFASVATPADMLAAPGSVGRPLPGVRVRIVDDTGSDLPVDEVGRIFVGNPMSFEGYTGGGDKERLDGLLATGDVGRLDRDGRLWVEGRDDDMIISGGENVFPAEVEETLRSHPEVADVSVVGVPDDKFGARLVAHVVRRAGSSVGEAALRDYVKASLATYKVPRDIVFRSDLPRNETGKVVKRDL